VIPIGKFAKIFVSIILAAVLSPVFTAKATEELIPIDVVLVLDVSRSMITADPDRIANKAMNMFIDMLEDGRDKVGIVAYAGHITYSRGLTLLCEEETPRLQNSITNLEYASWTDHPLGLLEAICILYEETFEERQQMIIFLTDGNLNVNPWGTRTTAEAEYDSALAVSLAQERDIPIYSIGLNFDGQLDRRYTEIVAYETGGLAFETSNAEDLPDIINAIFAVMMTKIQYVEEPEEDEKEEPLEEPELILAIEEPPYIPYEPLEKSRRIWLFAVAIIVAAALLLLAIFRKPRRVFTGRLAIEVIEKNNRYAQPLQYKNLIEYGRYTTLQRLIGNEIDAVFDKVEIIPSPTAPSYLPQLLITCKNSRISFTQNFMEQDAAKGIAISPGTEVTATLDAGEMHVRLRYIV